MTVEFRSIEDDILAARAEETRIRSAYQLVRANLEIVEAMDIYGSGEVWHKLLIKVADRIKYLKTHFSGKFDGVQYRVLEHERFGETIPEEFVTMTQQQVREWIDVKFDFNEIPSLTRLVHGLREDNELLTPSPL